MFIMPLTMSSVNWKGYDQVIHQLESYHPNAVIDGLGIPADSPLALPACLDMELDFGYVGFLCSNIRETDLLKILRFMRPQCRWYNKGEESLIYLAGTLQEWKLSVENGLQAGRPPIVNRFYTEIKKHLLAAGCSKMFESTKLLR